MLVVVRIDPTVDGPELAHQAREALASLADRPGFVRGWWARATDDPAAWVLATEWESVGAYRRALGSYDVKLRATPLLYQARDDVSAFEPLLVAVPGTVEERAGDLATE